MENTRSGLNGVTPCVGVWIETAAMAGSKSPASSHPAWVCGLKRLKKKMVLLNLKSHPAWVCGLKQNILAQMHPTQCHTLRGCVD